MTGASEITMRLQSLRTKLAILLTVLAFTPALPVYAADTSCFSFENLLSALSDLFAGSEEIQENTGNEETEEDNASDEAHGFYLPGG